MQDQIPPYPSSAMEIANNQPLPPQIRLEPLLARGGGGMCFPNDHSSLYAVTRDLRLRRAHIGFPDLLVLQDHRTTIDTGEKTYGSTGESNAGDAEGVG